MTNPFRSANSPAPSPTVASSQPTATLPTPPQVVILAAGMGKRMVSDTPKVLHRLAGRSLLGHVLDTAKALGCADPVVVIGHGAEAVRTAHAQEGVRFVVQDPPLGTGDAVRHALPLLHDEAPVLVLYGDVPLLTAEVLAPLVQSARQGQLALLTAHQPDAQSASGYGRIVRDAQGTVLGIREHKDANPAERLLTEINTGILCAPMPMLREWIARLEPSNAQAEYYLTDIVVLARAAGVAVQAHGLADVAQAQGVNDRTQLHALERYWQRRCAEQLLHAGVQVLDAARLEVRGTLQCGRDVSIDVGCVFEGRVELGDRVQVGPYCVLKDCVVHAGARIAPFSVLEGAVVGDDAHVGPFARLRPGTELDAGAHIGNFTEVKNSRIGKGSKANHLAYIGDTDIGSRVNVGAGTITCNYDGASKHRTVIEDDVFIGSDTQLVAPVRVGRGATLGAGTTLTRDAPPDQLTVSRVPQKSVPGWKRPIKHKT